jgi:hypothetical protein
MALRRRRGSGWKTPLQNPLGSGVTGESKNLNYRLSLPSEMIRLLSGCDIGRFIKFAVLTDIRRLRNGFPRHCSSGGNIQTSGWPFSTTTISPASATCLSQCPVRSCNSFFEIVVITLTFLLRRFV